MPPRIDPTPVLAITFITAGFVAIYAYQHLSNKQRRLLTTPYMQAGVFLAALWIIWSHHSRGIPWAIRLSQKEWSVQCCSPNAPIGIFTETEFVAMDIPQLVTVLRTLPDTPLIDTFVWLGHFSSSLPSSLRFVLHDVMWRARSLRVVSFHDAPFIENDVNLFQGLLAGDSNIEYLQFDGCQLSRRSWELIASNLKAPQLLHLFISDDFDEPIYIDSWMRAMRMDRPDVNVIFTSLTTPTTTKTTTEVSQKTPKQPRQSHSQSQPR